MVRLFIAMLIILTLQVLFAQDDFEFDFNFDDEFDNFNSEAIDVEKILTIEHEHWEASNDSGLTEHDYQIQSEAQREMELQMQKEVPDSPMQSEAQAQMESLRFVDIRD